jgi:hypothetical protein
MSTRRVCSQLQKINLQLTLVKSVTNAHGLAKERERARFSWRDRDANYHSLGQDGNSVSSDVQSSVETALVNIIVLYESLIKRVPSTRLAVQKKGSEIKSAFSLALPSKIILSVFLYFKDNNHRPFWLP